MVLRLRLNLFLPAQVENLESQVREQSLALQKAEASAAEALTQLQTAKEKVCIYSGLTMFRVVLNQILSTQPLMLFQFLMH